MTRDSFAGHGLLRTGQNVQFKCQFTHQIHEHHCQSVQCQFQGQMIRRCHT